jgi:hypothetical protein
MLGASNTTTGGIRVEQARVLGRLVKGDAASTSILPKLPEVIMEGDKKHFVLSEGSMGKRYELSGGVELGREWSVDVVDIEKMVRETLVSGQTGCIMGLGIGYFLLLTNPCVEASSRQNIILTNLLTY